MIIGNPAQIGLDVTVDEVESAAWDHLWVTARLWVNGSSLPGFTGRTEQAYFLETYLHPERWDPTLLRHHEFDDLEPAAILSTIWHHVYGYSESPDIDKAREYTKCILSPNIPQLEGYAMAVIGLESGFQIITCSYPDRDELGDWILPATAISTEVDAGFFERIHKEIVAFSDRETNARSLPIPWRK